MTLGAPLLTSALSALAHPQCVEAGLWSPAALEALPSPLRSICGPDGLEGGDPGGRVAVDAGAVCVSILFE